MGDYEVEVVATPGHSHDMLSYLFRSPRETMLFCGDTLFFGGKILLSNLYDCNVQDYVCSLRKLARQPFDGFFPGHNLWVVRGAAVHLNTAIDTLDRLLLPSNII
jgi:glyoxylase-like metal-dependent hydrolase (beta-lactamase superfamily II)